MCRASLSYSDIYCVLLKQIDIPGWFTNRLTLWQLTKLAWDLHLGDDEIIKQPFDPVEVPDGSVSTRDA